MKKIAYLLLIILICQIFCSCNETEIMQDADGKNSIIEIAECELKFEPKTEQEELTEREENSKQVEKMAEEQYSEQVVCEEISELGEYCVVKPTQAELDEVVYRLDDIISTFHKDYDYLTDNIYEYLFHYDHLTYVCPEYDDEVMKYVALPLSWYYNGNPSWTITINENDPLGRFNKIPEGIYDDEGNVDYTFVSIFTKNHDWREAITGHNRFSSAYIDWLVEGVWNGKSDHESFFEFKDGTQCYYYDGNYYTHEHDIGGRGGGIFHTIINENVEPIGDGKYKLTYDVVNDIQVLYGKASAVIALKEAQNGFRFWSIYSIDYQNLS